MRIGLVRHFQIPHNQFERMDAPGFVRWSQWYDTFQVAEAPLERPSFPWHRCLSSDLPRARFTAQKLYQGPIETTPLLREVPFAPLLHPPLHLPLFGWQILSRIGWYFNHASQPEGRRQTHARVQEFLDHLLQTNKGENVLVVTHGFFMQMLQTELHRSGFAGSLPWKPRFARVYPFDSP